MKDCYKSILIVALLNLLSSTIELVTVTIISWTQQSQCQYLDGNWGGCEYTHRYGEIFHIPYLNYNQQCPIREEAPILLCYFSFVLFFPKCIFMLISRAVLLSAGQLTMKCVSQILYFLAFYSFEV